MGALIRVAGPEAVDLDALATVYAAAFAGPPYSEPDASDLLVRLPRHRQQDGFVIALATEADRVVGFSYGIAHHGGTGSRWIALASEGDDVFEVVELAVHPQDRGRGIGAEMLDALLRDRSERRAALQTHDGDGPAMRLYERSGFHRLGATSVGVAMVKALH